MFVALIASVPIASAQMRDNDEGGRYRVYMPVRMNVSQSVGPILLDSKIGQSWILSSVKNSPDLIWAPILIDSPASSESKGLRFYPWQKEEIDDFIKNLPDKKK